MALQRRLVVGLGTVSCLLLVYLLCVSLETPLNISPLRSLQVFSINTLHTFHREDALHGENSILHRAHSEEASLSTTGPESPQSLQRNIYGQPAQNELKNIKSTNTTNTTNTTTTEPTTSLTTTPSFNRTTTKPGQNQSKPEQNRSKLGQNRSKPGLNQSKPGFKPGPTEPPFFGDSYFSEDGPPLSECASSLRGQISQSEFGTRFRPETPVLQWSKHVTPQQYLRLKQYPGAHGWGGVSYETLLETLSVLNSSDSGVLLDDWPQRHLNGSRCIRCAVVGNGGILKNSGRGTEIDQHHYVFRTNGAIIKGFEADVGSRTTHYTFSTNTLRNSLNSYRGAGYTRPPQSQETRYVFLPDHDRDYLLMKAAATGSRVARGPERNTDPAQFFGSDVSKEKLKMYHPDFIRYLRNRFLRSNALRTKYKDIYRPSTGAVMLLAALHTCDQVSAYGFMTPDYSRYSDHYYDKSFHHVGFFINHDLRLEMGLWQQLCKAGLIRLYMRQEEKNQD